MTTSDDIRCMSRRNLVVDRLDRSNICIHSTTRIPERLCIKHILHRDGSKVVRSYAAMDVFINMKLECSCILVSRKLLMAAYQNSPRPFMIYHLRSPLPLLSFSIPIYWPIILLLSRTAFKYILLTLLG